MAGKKGNKGHANKTSFTSENRTGVTQYEKWTEKETELFFNKALVLSRTSITLTDILNTLDTHHFTLDYLIEKYPKFATLKTQIMKQIENNTYKGALNGEYVPSVAIFGLKNNHGWKDKTEQEHTIKERVQIYLPKRNTDTEIDIE